MAVILLVAKSHYICGIRKLLSDIKEVGSAHCCE
jgi:hypothetical protein